MAAYLERSNANAGGAFASSRETDALLADAHQAAAELVGRRGRRDRLRRQHDDAQLPALARARAHARARRRGRRHPARPRRQRQPLVPRGGGPRARDPGRADRPGRRLARHRGARGADRRARPGWSPTRSPRTRSATSPTRPGSRRRRTRSGPSPGPTAVHLAPHRRLDREALGADVLLCSPYKFFGPHLGLAAIRRDLAESLPADRVRAADTDPPGHRFETGTLSHEALAGTVAAIDYIAGARRAGRRPPPRGWTPRSRRSARTRSSSPLRFLAGARRDRRRAPPRDRRPGAGGRAHADLPALGRRSRAGGGRGAALGERGMFTWDGHFYAVGPVKALGLLPDGALRVGFLHYTTTGEVDDLAAGAGRDRRMSAAERARSWRRHGAGGGLRRRRALGARHRDEGDPLPELLRLQRRLGRGRSRRWTPRG